MTDPPGGDETERPGTGDVRRLVVLGDSLAVCGPNGVIKPTDQRLYANVAASVLSERTGERWQAELVVRLGWSTKAAARDLARDLPLVRRITGADAYLVGVGSMDSAPVGVPSGLTIRLKERLSPRTRARLNRVFEQVHPHLVRLSRGRIRFSTRRSYRASLTSLLRLVADASPRAPIVAVLPAVHGGSEFFAGMQPHHAAFVEDTVRVGRAEGIPLIDLPRLLGPNLDGLAPDRAHWNYEMHERVGRAAADALVRPEGSTSSLRHILALSWHAEHGALIAGGHRRTIEVVERLPPTAHLTICDNTPTMFSISDGVDVREYRLPVLARLARVDRRVARVVQWSVATIRLVLSGVRADRRDPVDVIYVPNSEILPSIVAGVLLRRILRVPLVACTMSAEELTLPRLIHRLHRSVDEVVTLSGGLADALLAKGLLRRPHVIGCGSVTPLLQPKEEKKRWDAIFVGRHTPEKGVYDLLATWARVTERLPHAKLAMIGACSPEMRREIESRSAASGLPPGSVTLLGVLSEHDKNIHIAQARLMLFPSRSEGWGFAPLEALAAGIPVICWDLPAYATSLPRHEGVRRVACGDVEELARSTVAALERPDEELAGLARGARASGPSWDAVAAEEWAVVLGSIGA